MAAFSGATGFALAELADQTKLEIRRNCMPQVDALLLAGWKWELPEIVNRKDGENFTRMDTEPWQWYWRAPSKRAGGKGRRYLSTNQAFNALQREAQNAKLRHAAYENSRKTK